MDNTLGRENQKKKTMPEIIFRGHTFNYQGNEGFWNGLDGWEKETFDVLDKYIGKDSVVLDVGAWMGIISLYASKLGGNAFAFEPDDVRK